VPVVSSACGQIELSRQDWQNKHPRTKFEQARNGA